MQYHIALCIYIVKFVNTHDIRIMHYGKFFNSSYIPAKNSASGASNFAASLVELWPLEVGAKEDISFLRMYKVRVNHTHTLD